MQLSNTLDVRSSRAMQALAAVALIFFARYAEAILLPVAVALVLTFLLSPLVRGMRRHGVPDALGAAVVVGGFVLAVSIVASMLTAPAAVWWEKAPQGIQQLIERAEQWRRTVPFLAPAPARPSGAARGPAPVAPDPVKEKIASESVALTGALLLRAGNAGIFVAATLMLLFFLLASERWLVTRTVQAVPQRRRRVTIIGAVRDAQRDIARFLATQAMINFGVAIATGLACWGIGVAEPCPLGRSGGHHDFHSVPRPDRRAADAVPRRRTDLRDAGRVAAAATRLRGDQHRRKQFHQPMGRWPQARTQPTRGIPDRDVHRLALGHRRSLYRRARVGGCSQCGAPLQEAARMGHLSGPRAGRTAEHPAPARSAPAAACRACAPAHSAARGGGRADTVTLT